MNNGKMCAAGVQHLLTAFSESSALAVAAAATTTTPGAGGDAVHNGIHI